MRRYAVVFVILGSILWGTDSLFRRPLSRSLSPVTIVFLEHCVLSLVVLPSLLRSGGKIGKLNRKDWMSISFIALGGSVGATSFFTYAIKYGNPSVTVLLQKTQPLFTILMARWFLAEKPGRWFYRWVMPTIAGAYLVSEPDWRSGLSIASNQPLSLAAALGASLLWGSCTVFGRHVVGRLPVFTLTALRFVLALPALAAIYWLQPAVSRQIEVTSNSAITVVGMALIPGLMALLFYYRGLRDTLASIASLAELAFPLTAILANWLFLAIRLTATQLLGGIILVTSVTALTHLNARDKACELQSQGI